MGKCKTCSHWRPVNWDVTTSTYIDIVARCNHQEKYKVNNDSCNAHTTETIQPQAIAENKYITVPTYKHGELKPLKNHQKLAMEKSIAAFDLLGKNYVPLFFEAGCGKSATALRLAVALWEKNLIDTILIIAPNKIHYTWYQEHVPQWLTDISYVSQIFGGHRGKNHIRPVVHGKEVLQVLCVNIDTFSTPEKWKQVVDWTLDRRVFTILDEATSIKNIKSKRTERMLYAFNTVRRSGKIIKSSIPNCVYRCALTGTPVTNNVSDLWSIMEFLKPNYWGRNYYSFRNRYCMMMTIEAEHGAVKIPINREAWERIKEMDDFYEAHHVFNINEDTWYTIKGQDYFQGANKHLDELKEKLHSDAFFVKLVDCEDMPPQNYIKRIVPMGEEQQKAYEELETHLITMYEGKECSISNKLVLYLRLQQISSGFISVIEIPDTLTKETVDDYDIPPRELHWFKDVPKLDMLYQDIESVEKPALIFTRFSAEAARIYDDLEKKGLKVCLQTGWKTIGHIEDYQAGKYDVMVANIQSMSRGFNLQNGWNTHYYSNLFSLELRIQGEGRTFRIGQTRPTNYFDYISEDTIDMKIVAALIQRREVMDYITNKDVKTFLTEWDGIVDQEYASIYGSHF